MIPLRIFLADRWIATILATIIFTIIIYLTRLLDQPESIIEIIGTLFITPLIWGAFFLVGLSIAWLIAAGINLVFDKNILASPTVVPSTLQGEPILDILEIGTNANIVETEIIPLYNCGSLTEYGVTLGRSRTVERTITLDRQIKGEIQGLIILGIEGHYGIENGQIEERSYTINLTAPANSWMEYTINWRYIWREGQITIKSPDDTEQVYPYRLRSAVEFEIANIEKKNCQP